jgi:hypothetical protein
LTAAAGIAWTGAVTVVADGAIVSFKDDILKSSFNYPSSKFGSEVEKMK